VFVPAAVVAVDFNVAPGATDDLVDNDPGDGVCDAGGGVCTLRAAVQEANETSARDRIVVPAGTYVLTRLGADEDSADLGDLDLLQDVDIEGAGAGLTVVDGNLGDRVFDVAFGVAASLSGMTVRNGRVQPPVSPTGGGIVVRTNGSLDLVECVVEGNHANHGGGLNAFPGSTISVVDSQFRGNRAQDPTYVLGDGGAISSRGDIDIEGSSLSGNSADGDGGAVESANGVLSLRNSTVSGNRAGLLGGGIIALSTDVDLVNATIFGNEGIGLLAASPGSSKLSMKNSIVAASSSVDCAFYNVTPEVAGGHNLDSDGTCELDDLAGDLPSTDPLLDRLLWNGGATLTQVPQRGSPVIDAGDDATCEAADQRGAGRPLDGDNSGGDAVCDIGAVEVLPCVAPWNEDEQMAGWAISGFELCEACFTITAGPDFVVEGPSGMAVLKARDTIILLDGFTVESGGTFQAVRDPAAGSGITLP
jgi:CSLREA domain-containing protein